MATLGNTGPNPATNVVVSLPLSSNLVFDSSTSGQGTVQAECGPSCRCTGLVESRILRDSAVTVPHYAHLD